MQQGKFKIKFDHYLCDGKVNRIRCQLCLRWEPKIKRCKNVSQVWVSRGSESIMKDNVKKHAKFLQYCKAYEFQRKCDLQSVTKYLCQNLIQTLIRLRLTQPSNQCCISFQSFTLDIDWLGEVLRGCLQIQIFCSDLGKAFFN